MSRFALLSAALLALAGGQRVQVEKVLFPGLPAAPTLAGNEDCARESRLVEEHLGNYTLWAHEIRDASAKSVTGVLRGSLFQMGDYEECITTKAPFKTRYCLTTIKAHVPVHHKRKDPISLHYDPYDPALYRIYEVNHPSQISRHTIKAGWCVPASCAPGDVETSLNRYLEAVEHPLVAENVSYTAVVTGSDCQTENERDRVDGLDIGFCLAVAVLALCVVSSTFYDFQQKKEIKEKSSKPIIYNLFLSFSAKRNFLDLPKAEDSNPALSILYGMRTFCVLMIIMDHRFGTYISGPLMNNDYVEYMYRSDSAWFIFHGDLFVDSFFILSGILVAHGLLRQFDKKIINPGYLVFLRYIRLTPAYAFAVFYYASVFAHVGSGPLWKIIISPEVEDCRNNWYLNLLYISNYVNDANMCMVHSWYLPCDFHYFIIGIFICMLIKKNRRLGLAVLTFFTVLSIAVPFAITMIYARPALLNFYPDFLVAPKIHTDFRLTYTKSHTRATPYFIGIFAGYFYYKAKMNEKDTLFSKFKSHLITLLSLILLFGSMVGGSIFYNPYHPYHAGEAALYASLHRLSWSLGTVGLLVAASHGHATALKYVMSWSPWIPLSKLVYAAYLFHMQYLLRAVAIAPGPRMFNFFDTIYLAIGDWVVSFATALLVYLGIEAPFRKIFKQLLTPHRKPVVPLTNGGINNEPVLRESRRMNGNRDCDSRL